MHVMGFGFHLVFLALYPNDSLICPLEALWLFSSLGFGCESGTGVAVGLGSRTTTPYQTMVGEHSGLEWKWAQLW